MDTYYILRARASKWHIGTHGSRALCGTPVDWLSRVTKRTTVKPADNQICEKCKRARQKK